ncbi:hypothetical protein BDC45DRAFT_152589 [Circinella umbellata]|nr:hypothetical protein BDC45DRAFT_152589 [Circinella umbellata]
MNATKLHTHALSLSYIQCIYFFTQEKGLFFFTLILIIITIIIISYYYCYVSSSSSSSKSFTSITVYLGYQVYNFSFSKMTTNSGFRCSRCRFLFWTETKKKNRKEGGKMKE